MEILGISKTRASQVINSLGLMKILTVTENLNGKIKKYLFNKDFDLWDIPLRKTLTVKKKSNNRSSISQQTVTENLNHKIQYTKDNTKDNLLCGLFSVLQGFEEFWKLYPSRRGKKLLKGEALRMFKKTLKSTSFCSIFQAVRNYGISKTVTDGFAKDAVRFLKKDYWRDWLSPEEDKPLRSLKNLPHAAVGVKKATYHCKPCSDKLREIIMHRFGEWKECEDILSKTRLLEDRLKIEKINYGSFPVGVAFGSK